MNTKKYAWSFTCARLFRGVESPTQGIRPSSAAIYFGGGFRGCILQSIEISIKQILGKREKHIDGDGVNERGEEKV